MKKVLFVFLFAFGAQSVYSQCDQCDDFYLSNFGLCIVDGGCNDSSALNYSGDDCSSETFINENCDFGAAGCTCPDSYNYNPSAVVDDGSCVVLSGGCGDDTAENYSGNACATAIFAAPDCQYGSVELGEFSYTITDANMTVQVGVDVVTFNGEEPPIGALLGAFFTNDAGELQCAGYQPWTGDQLAIAVWASESGLDNGFSAGEEFIWGLSIGGQSFAASTSTMNSSPPFSNTFTSNGFGQVLGAEFSGELTAILGCTDDTAINYNSDATVDDGSCYTLVWDEPNTGANATIAVTPEGPNVSEITFNGEPFPVGAYLGVFFTNDDGQYVCGGMEEWTGTNIAMAAWGDDTQTPEKDGFSSGEEYTLFAYIYGQSFLATSTEWQMMGGFSNTYALNGFGMLISASFEGEITSTPGCMDQAACNYDLTATVDDGSCTYADGLYDCDGVCYNDADGDTICDDEDACPNDAENDADGDGVCESDEINGCTDSQACNYDSSATEDNGTCIQPITWYWDTDGDGLGDDTFTMEACSQPGPEFVTNIDDLCPLDPENDADGDGVCESDEVEGCTGSDSINYNPDATEDDGSCIIAVPGCMDSGACNFDASSNIDDGSCEYTSCSDCAGVPFGNSVLDNCGTCDNDSSNDCVQDCAGEWGGDAIVDNCGACDNDASNDCVQDCSGVWGGAAVVDNCGTCDNDASNDCVQDCTGEWGGDAVVDNCGTCDDDVSNDCTTDCAGVFGGDAVLDECGTCDNDAFNDCVQDCAGEWGGNAVVDNCGTCDNDASNDCVQDCAGEWGGDAVVDNCGICDDDASNDCVQDCAGIFGGDAVLDNCGTCDNDASNDCVQDCAGEWGGDAVVDLSLIHI